MLLFLLPRCADGTNQKYLVGNSKGWDQLTDEERLDILSKAHTAGSNAAKKWYTKLKKIK